MSEVPLYTGLHPQRGGLVLARALIQGYLAHKKTPTPLGPP